VGLLSTDAEYLQRFVTFYEQFACGRISLGEANRNLINLNDELGKLVSPSVRRKYVAKPGGLENRGWQNDDDDKINLDEVWMQSNYC